MNISCNLNTKEVIAHDNNQIILVLTVEYSKTMEDGFSSQSSLTNNDVLSIDTRLVLRHTLFDHHENKDHSGWGDGSLCATMHL